MACPRKYTERELWLFMRELATQAERDAGCEVARLKGLPVEDRMSFAHTIRSAHRKRKKEGSLPTEDPGREHQRQAITQAFRQRELLFKKATAELDALEQEAESLGLSLDDATDKKIENLKRDLGDLLASWNGDPDRVAQRLVETSSSEAEALQAYDDYLAKSASMMQKLTVLQKIKQRVDFLRAVLKKSGLQP